MSTPDDPALDPEPKRLRYLRLLVTILTATMIIGLIIILGLIVTMFTERWSRSSISLPDTLELPADHAQAEAITVGDDWIGVVTTGPEGRQSIHILDAKTGKLRQSVAIEN